jgi:hypothetical protein
MTQTLYAHANKIKILKKEKENIDPSPKKERFDRLKSRKKKKI